MHLAEERPDLALVGDGELKPLKLFEAQRDGDGLAFDTARPLVTWATLARSATFQDTAEGNPADVGQAGTQATVAGWQ